MALNGQQTVHLAATIEGTKPTSNSPFPPCGAITAGDPFPQSPTPAFTLLTQNIIGGPVAYTPGAYLKGQTSIDVMYFIGSTRQTATIIVTEPLATVVSGL